MVDFAAHLLDEGGTASSAPLQEVLDPGLGVGPLELAALDELLDQLLGSGPGQVGERDPGVEVALEESLSLVGHETKVYGSAS